MTTYRGLIFDFGGVVTRTLFETHDMNEAALGLAPGTLTWRGPFDPASDPLWQAMLRDELSERDYWQTRTREVAGLSGRDWSAMADFVRAVRGDAPARVIRPEFLHLAGAARAAGLKLAILSNELDLFYGADFRDRLPFLRDFDVIHDATHTGILKPDAHAYRDCLASLGLPADACLFIDDQARNIAGARAVGLAALRLDVTNAAAGFAEAGRMLGLLQETEA